MNQMSTVGWIAVILLAALVIGTNLSLIAALRDRQKKESSSKLLNSWKIMKDPWDEEERQWTELSENVRKLDSRQPGGDQNQS